jgi:hypothetical protein
MTRVFTSAGIAGRPTASVVISALAVLYGVFEIWHASTRTPLDTTGLGFGVLFIGGGIYGLWKTWTDARDVVVSLDVDEASGAAAVALWRPFRPLVLKGPLARLSNWHHHVAVGPRDRRTHMIRCDLAAYPRPVRFEFLREVTITDGLRRIAPEAVAEFEDAIGVSRQA